ncbi:MAG TPA: DegT/DnrJ/EryC1/StrS family aminotransferase [Syntrophorhabdaceae bacterium]|nr:DegT/DnrJ/EryC1/StrS family aminotransferase [Syntrophorhabdaceae bacterium]
MKVNIFNLERDHAELQEELLVRFKHVLTKGDFILGKEVTALEEAFAEYVGTSHAVGVGSGTDALRVGGLALDIKAGDKFVTAPNSYIASAMALSMHGLVPRFCDIELDTHNMDPERLGDLLRKEEGIKLCIPVHLYGHPCMLDEIMDVCRKHGIMVMEDACQAHGALYKGKKVGTYGDVTAFSFYPTKNLGAYGDGGIVTTDSEKVFKKATMLRNYGQSAKHVHDIEGFNSRLDELQASLLRIKLDYLDAWNDRRRYNASLYNEGLQGLPIILPQETPWAHHVYHLYVIRSKERDRLRAYLNDRGISTLIHYPTPIHLQKVYQSLGYEAGSFPNAELAAQEVVSLPMYPSLTQDEIAYVSECVRKFYGA